MPKVALFGETDFFVLLSQWLSNALRELDDETSLTLDRVSCRDATRDADLTPEALCIYFPAAFLEVLADAKGSKWRTALLDSLRAADENRQSLARQLGWTRLVLGSSAVGGLTAVTTTLSGATDHQTLYAALTALGISVPAQLAAAWRGRAVARDQLRTAVRAAVSTWMDDCGAALTEPPQGGVRRSPIMWIAELRAGDDPLLVPEEMVDHLARLRVAAANHGEQDLATQLFELEDALARIQHNPHVREEALASLEAIASALMSSVADDQA